MADDQQDILLVQNIDLNCDFEDPTENYSHQDFFQVRWDKAPFRVAPGEKRRFPRYIAEHFAKHLCDHILIKEGEQTGNEFLIGNVKRRQEILDKIILKVDQYYLPQENETEGQRIAKEVDKMNEEDNDKPMDIGKITDPMLGENVTPANPPVEPTEKPKGKERSIKELREECNKLNIPYKITESKDALLEKLTNF